MDNTIKTDVILDKKMDSYGYENKDFLASGELTVTITLGEYRKLVTDVATANQRIDKANEDSYERNAENEKLKKENSDLKAELYELKKTSDMAAQVCEQNEEDGSWKSE